MQIRVSVKKCQNYRFFDILWNILEKRQSSLGQECVKRGLLSFQDKIGTIAPDFPGKMRVFPVLALLFHLSCLHLNIGILGLKSSNFPDKTHRI